MRHERRATESGDLGDGASGEADDDLLGQVATLPNAGVAGVVRSKLRVAEPGRLDLAVWIPAASPAQR